MLLEFLFPHLLHHHSLLLTKFTFILVRYCLAAILVEVSSVSLFATAFEHWCHLLLPHCQFLHCHSHRQPYQKASSGFINLKYCFQMKQLQVYFILNRQLLLFKYFFEVNYGLVHHHHLLNLIAALLTHLQINQNPNPPYQELLRRV